MMVGTPDEELLKEPVDLLDVLNDFDYDALPSIKNDAENRKKMQKIITEKEITIIRPPRPLKKLLVLDLDYTLLDMKSGENIAEKQRPYLQTFMTAVYTKYDIAIWSQTHWRWIELKLTEMGLLLNVNFCISFVLDKTFMFPITSKDKEGKERTHEVKALEIIWTKMPHYNARNTIHVDDLGRNFAMNPENGLKIKPFKYAEVMKQTDQELLYLKEYLLQIADSNDLSALNHRKWKKKIEESKK